MKPLILGLADSMSRRLGKSRRYRSFFSYIRKNYSEMCPELQSRPVDHTLYFLIEISTKLYEQC